MADDQTALSINEKVNRSSGRELFRPIQDLIRDGDQRPAPKREPIAPAVVAAWLAEHLGAVAVTKLKVRFGFPERDTRTIPCLAVQRDGGYILMLNVDGTTHRFHADECEV